MENIYFTFFTETGASLVTQMVKNLPAMQKTRVGCQGGEDPLEKEMQPTPVFLRGEFHGQRRWAGYSPWGWKELDTTEPLTLTKYTAEKIPAVCAVGSAQNLLL